MLLADYLDAMMECLYGTIAKVKDVPLPLLLVLVLATAFGVLLLLFLSVYLVAPNPRPAKASEKTYRSITSEGKVAIDQRLPCWMDRFTAEKDASRHSGKASPHSDIEAADVLVSVVIPAYNEQDRLGIMLTEAVEYLEENYPAESGKKAKPSNGSAKGSKPSQASGYEILIVSDGSTDNTIDTALEFARKSSSPSKIRVISLSENRGKGGAVTHGLRHVRGAYAIFADADGASRFSDLGSLLDSCRKLQAKDPSGYQRGVVVGSRAHLVGSEAVVKRSFLRNFLMHGFHLFLRLLTPPRTARIRDTQCGFKLFSRSALPEIVPYMHSEGWIFDVEMLMLAESAGIEVAEVPVGWHEVTGSKLNVIKDSLAMAWGLTVLRLAWGMGIYKRT